MTFQPGQSGNPNGRAKGKYTEYTRKFLSLRSKAAEDVDKAYELLKGWMEKGEQWAFKIYFTDLVHYPAKEHQELATITIKKGSTVEEVRQAFIEGLEQIDQYNSDEILNAVKTCNSIKLTETIAEKTSEAAHLTDDQIKMVTDMVTDMNKNNTDMEVAKKDDRD